MASSTYLGTAQFGTEAFHADGHDVTFEASSIDMNIQTTSIAPTKPNTTPTTSSTAPTKSSTAPAKTNSVPAKSNAVSLKGVKGFKWYWTLLEAAVGAWMLWFWML